MGERMNPVKCPNPRQGEMCGVCGGSYLCLEPWRKARTTTQRVKDRQKFNREKRK